MKVKVVLQSIIFQQNLKKYYAIFFKDTKEKKILTDPEEVNSILYKSSYLCRKFVTEEEAKRWLEIVAEKEKDIES